MIRVFNNTIVSKQSGIYVGGGDPNYEQKVIGNAVFTSNPISASDQADNIFDTYSNAVNYLNNPFGEIGVDVDLHPKSGMLKGSPIDTGSFNTFTDWNKDFNSKLHDGTFRGAYASEGGNTGWLLKLERKPMILDNTPPTTPQNTIATATSESSIAITWQASGDPESGISNYKIYRDGVHIGQSALTSFTDTGLSEATTYLYQVSAVNGAWLESGKSAIVSATTFDDTIPPAITSVSTTSESNVKILFSEPLYQTSAETASNYEINNGITITSATLSSDHKTVTLTTSPHQDGITYTLTVNNIKDRASTPNTISSNTQKTYTFVSELVITNLSVTSGQTYEVVTNGLAVGSLVYIDRGYTYTSVPSSLHGATYIKTANDDKSSNNPSFLTFHVNQDVTVYVGHDDRTTPKPSWLESFTDTGNDIITSDTTLSIYAKDFSSGTIVLGGNEGTASMYTVILKTSQGIIDSISPMPPSNLRGVEQ
jgi:hypothetical protein